VPSGSSPGDKTSLEVATGKVITDLRKSHTAADFVAFLNKIDREVTDDLDVHVILDNLSTHKTPAVREWLLRHSRFHFQRSAHRSVQALAQDIRDWVETWNDNPRLFTWHKRAEEILDRLAGSCRPRNN
jgi:hypothetical protein